MADTDDLFEKFDKMLNTYGESKATPMDILKLIAIIRIGGTDIKLIKKCFEYVNKTDVTKEWLETMEKKLQQNDLVS
jgi:hypothetical protein